MTHIHRPVQRQLDVAEHGPIHPQAAVASPERRMVNSGLLSPRPPIRIPQCLVRVAACLHKQQEVAVLHVVIVDRKLRHEDFLRLKLVVPAELIAVFTSHA